MPDFFRSLRYAVRRLRMSPVFSITAILTLSLGIGGTTAIFTLVDAVMLRSLPVADPAKLFRIGDGENCCVQGGIQDNWGMFSYPLYQRLRQAVPEFEELAAFQAGGARLTIRRANSNEPAKPLRTEYVSGNYFATFGIGSFAGRVFTPSDDQSGAVPVVVLSHHAWEAAYGSDPSIIGRSLVIESQPFTVVGVAPPGFFGDTLRGDPADVWIPLGQEPLVSPTASMLRQQPAAWLRIIGRLRPGSSIDGIRPRLTGVLRQWIVAESGYPSNWMPEILRNLSKQFINVVPAGSGVGEMKENYRSSLQILFVVCALVLLIACANVANLLLARSVSQRGQTAVRLAIGASRSQIVAQALVESVLLAIGGGLAGLLIANLAARLLLRLAFNGVRFLPISVSPSPLVLAFSFGVALLTGILFGAAPAWLSTRTNAADVLRGSGRSTTSRSSLVSKSLLVVQAALSVVLVAGATMLSRSLNNLEHQNFGFAPEGRLMVYLRTPHNDATPQKLNALYREVINRVNAIPGVEGSGLALYNPLVDNWGERIYVAAHAPLPEGADNGSSWDHVTSEYMQTLGMTMLRGRTFTAHDNETTAPVAIVNEAFVKRFFKSDEDPIGQHFGIDLPQYASTFQIIGINRDAKFASFALNRSALPMFFVPITQFIEYKEENMRNLETRAHFAGGLVLKTNTPSGTLEPIIRKTLSDIDPDFTVSFVRTLQDQIALSFSQRRAVASLAALFGIVALLLAAIGLYGVTAYTVAQRTSEIGVRVALGATRLNVIGMILRGASLRVLIGLAFGVPLAIGAGHLISAQLYGVSSSDPLALLAAAFTLAAAAFIAALIPARRAASISPIEALRNE